MTSSELATTTEIPRRAAQYLPFVRKIAVRIARKLPSSVDVEDLVSAGTVGLMEALDRFDPVGGRSFETYAEFRIKGAIIDELRKNDPLNRSARTFQARVAQKVQELTKVLGREPSSEELATALDTSLDELSSSLSLIDSAKTTEVDVSILRDDSEFSNQEHLITHWRRLELLKQTLEELPERQKQVLNLYYIDELNQRQIGDILSITESRVCQILTAIRRKLKTVCDELEE